MGQDRRLELTIPKKDHSDFGVEYNTVMDIHTETVSESASQAQLTTGTPNQSKLLNLVLHQRGITTYRLSTRLYEYDEPRKT